VIVVSDHGHRPWGHLESPPAFFLAAGPLVRSDGQRDPATLGRASLKRLGTLFDVAPTLLSLQEVPLGLDLDGRVLEEVLAPSASARAQPAAVATHDDAAWLAAREAGARGGVTDPERIEQLRALGYVQ
jgi:hypothetical protein